MNTPDEIEETPFVNEECGDTMWDEETLNQLTRVITIQPNEDKGSGLDTDQPVKNAVKEDDTTAID